MSRAIQFGRKPLFALAILSLSGGCPSGKGNTSTTLSSGDDATTEAAPKVRTIKKGTNTYHCRLLAESLVEGPCTIKNNEGEALFAMSLPDAGSIQGTLNATEYGFKFTGTIDTKAVPGRSVESDFFHQGQGGFASVIKVETQRPYQLTLVPR
ncbi:MAG: hypothetical protein JKY56_00970 [Kofleriaceae bacterium]|nr:hypothetical protein [Kofleriaceae bacterium]